MRSLILRRTRVAAPLLALGLVAGCASGLPLGPDVMLAGQAFPAAQGEADVVIRTHVVDAAGQAREVAGATCEVRTVLYSVKVTTPVRLRLPNFGAQSPDLVISCVADKRRGTLTRPIVTTWRTAPGAYSPWGWYGPPGWGPAWGGPGWGGPWGWPEPSFPVSSYPDVSVELR